MTDILILDELRLIRADLVDLRTDIAEIRQRLGSLEQQSASLSRRVDRLHGDLEHVKIYLNENEVRPAPAF